ncbi:hypothetical protein [Nocardioides insulae]|uniref:hypothetical protein n=1 Tax=Nocardioides insulae TaxID=394734 RepID=UPI0004116C67|nr:hypothetical protein [Nocardioides insulae]
MSSAPAERLAPVRRRVAALDRARLAVVPRTKVRAPKLPFVMLVSALLIGGIVGLLFFNTSMQQAAFTGTSLEDRATSLAARQQTLEMELEELRDPQQIAVKARRQGLVIPAGVAMLEVPSGKVTGTAEPADAGSTPRLWPKIHKPRFASPDTARSTVPATPATGAPEAAERSVRNQRLNQAPGNAAR